MRTSLKMSLGELDKVIIVSFHFHYHSEGLSRLMVKMRKIRSMKGFIVSRGGLIIFHLRFADVTLLLCEALEMMGAKEILDFLK